MQKAKSNKKILEIIYFRERMKEIKRMLLQQRRRMIYSQLKLEVPIYLQLGLGNLSIYLNTLNYRVEGSNCPLSKFDITPKPKDLYKM